RAGIIVPEGIIFQSQNAYKSLRKMLVENYLWAVVSLPAGVFNPYSGVKTSILFLDRNLARRMDEVLFVKVESDGFDLGAQRRQNGKNDLPEALEILDSHKNAPTSAKASAGRQKAQESKLALTVSRKRLLESPHIILSGDRYRETAAVQSKWPMVRLGEVIRTITSPKKIQKAEFGKAGMYPIIDQSQDEIAGWTDDSTATVNVAKAVVIFGDHTCSVKYTERPFVQGADGIKILETSDLLQPRFLFYWLKTFPIQSDGYKRHYSKLMETVIPLPPLEEQERIVAELEGYRKVIEGARQILASYKPTIRIDPAWSTVKLGDVCKCSSGGTPPKTNEKYWTGTIPWVSAKDMKSECLSDASLHISETAVAESATQIAPIGALLVLVRGMGLANGVPVCELAVPCAFNQDVKAIIPNRKVNSAFLRVILKQQAVQAHSRNRCAWDTEDRYR
ncbi:MAG TPA: hypothetical protein DCE18_03810, partial [Syntrophobacteraceae bacterium]|nr:hypothetical protein [Syntrophobacteraceae bacterium]